MVTLIFLDFFSQMLSCFHDTGIMPNVSVWVVGFDWLFTTGANLFSVNLHFFQSVIRDQFPKSKRQIYPKHRTMGQQAYLNDGPKILWWFRLSGILCSSEVSFFPLCFLSPIIHNYRHLSRGIYRKKIKF